MVVVALLPVLALLSTTGNDAAGELMRGSSLYRGCQAELRLMHLPSLAQAAESDLLNGTYCIGYVNGFVSQLRRDDAVCPAGVPTGSLVEGYVSYMDSHPELLSQDRGIGLSMALRSGFSCSASPAPTALGGSGDRTTL